MNDERIFLSFGFQNKSISMGLYLYFILYIPISYVIYILQFILIRSFEYDYDRPVFMPVDSRELMAQADSITTPENLKFEDEKIIGVPLVRQHRVLERKPEN